MNKNTATAAIVLVTAVILSGCGFSETRLSDDTTPVASEPIDAVGDEKPKAKKTAKSIDISNLKVSDELVIINYQMRTGSVQNDPRTGKPLPEKFFTFMKFLNDTNLYVVQAVMTDKAEIIAAYKRVWDWAYASGLGLYAALTSEELEAGIDPQDPTPATILNIVTADGTNYCAIDIRYLGQELEPSHLIRQSLLAMPCAYLATEVTE